MIEPLLVSTFKGEFDDQLIRKRCERVGASRGPVLDETVQMVV